MNHIRNDLADGPQRRGGPRTAQGKAASRANALKHGLSASTLMPAILDVGLVDQFQQKLCNEWKPTTPTQEFLVREMARHQAALERIEQIEEAVLRRGTRGALNPLGAGDAEDEFPDAALAAAGTSEAIERITRYRRPHERAYLKYLAIMRDLQATAKRPGNQLLSQQQGASHSARQSRFRSDADCEHYLLAWQAGRALQCPRCGAEHPHWITSRRLWQCRGCKRQSTLRTGTVMERSRLSLLAWFRAIETLLQHPSASTAELMNSTGVRRLGTVRSIARRIRGGMHSTQASAQLAGLDQVFPRPAAGSS